MPKDRTRGKAGHAAGTKLDRKIRTARADVEKRQRQLAAAMADLAALEAHQAAEGTGHEHVDAPTDEAEAGTPADSPAEPAPSDEPAPEAAAAAEPEAGQAEEPEAAPTGELAGAPTGEPQAAPAEDAATDSSDTDAKKSDQWIGELEPGSAEASDSTAGSESTEGPDGTDPAAAPESSDTAESPESSDSTLIG